MAKPRGKHHQPNPAQRRGLLAKVHVAKKQLGMADDDYRVMLEARFGVRSSADLTIGQLERLISLFEKGGWQAPERHATGADNRATEAQIARIKVLWGLFARKSDWAAFEAWLRRYWKRDRVEWLTRQEASKVIATLGRMNAKQGLDRFVAAAEKIIRPEAPDA